MVVSGQRTGGRQRRKEAKKTASFLLARLPHGPDPNALDPSGKKSGEARLSF